MHFPHYSDPNLFLSSVKVGSSKFLPFVLPPFLYSFVSFPPFFLLSFIIYFLILTLSIFVPLLFHSFLISCFKPFVFFYKALFGKLNIIIYKKTFNLKICLAKERSFSRGHWQKCVWKNIFKTRKMLLKVRLNWYVACWLT